MVILAAFELSDSSLGCVKKFQILIKWVHNLTAEDGATERPLLTTTGPSTPSLPIPLLIDLPCKRRRHHVLVINSSTAVENHIVWIIRLLGLSVWIEKFVFVLI